MTDDTTKNLSPWEQKTQDEFPGMLDSSRFDCGPGWHQLAYRMMQRLHDLDPSLRVYFKQKYAELVVSVERPGDREMRAKMTVDENYEFSISPKPWDEIVTEAEAEALHTCEKCGSTVGTSVYDDGWMIVLCSACREQRSLEEHDDEDDEPEVQDPCPVNETPAKNVEEAMVNAVDEMRKRITHTMIRTLYASLDVDPGPNPYPEPSGDDEPEVHHCRDCKWWATHTGKRGSCAAIGATNNFPMSQVEGAGVVVSGPDFGCVHWEEKT